MNLLVVPDPVGTGTQVAESMLSVVKRTAALYRVTLSRLIRLATSVKTSELDSRYYDGLGCWLGGSELCRRLVTGLHKLSGKDLGSVSFVSQSVLWTSAATLIAPSPRSCPVCADPAAGVNYEMLCHQMAHVKCCPLHDCMLNERCLACGKRFRPQQWLAKGARCGSCEAPLWDQLRVKERRDAYDLWCEKQALDFAAATTSSEFELDESNWMLGYHAGVQALARSTMEDYQLQERIFVRENLRQHEKVRFKTLLKIASMQACTLMDLIERPAEMLSPRLPRIGQVLAPRVRRTHFPGELLAQMKAYLEALIASDVSVSLPSKRAVCRKFNLDCGILWRAYPELSFAYSAARRKHSEGRRDRENAAASAEAQILLRALVLSDSWASPTALTKSIQASCGVTRVAATFGLRAGVKEVFGHRIRWACRPHQKQLTSAQVGWLRRSVLPAQ